MPAHARSLRQFCSGILGSGDLKSKLSPPHQQDGQPLDDSNPGQPIYIAHPVRNPEIAMAAGLPSLPKVGALASPEARIKCLARFAHHELMAVELFAWALLRWPNLPPELRREFTRVLADEQRHCRLYLDRLNELGGSFFEPPYSNYFWKHVPAISESPHGPSAFLAAMGLTLEQANLDFTLMYREAFAAAGDEKSAAVLLQVHEDEINHVAMAAHWIKLLGPPGSDLIEAYSEAVPFPFSAARAKARQFDAAARRRAGLGKDFIEFVREAQSSQNRSKAKPNATDEHTPSEDGILLYPNVGGEELPGKDGVVMTNATLPTLRLWRLLFGPSTRYLATPIKGEPADVVAALNLPWWPEGLGDPPTSSAFSWLDDCKGVVPWISTARLQLVKQLEGHPITSAPAGVVTRVHDKAFANDLAVTERLMPERMRNLFLVLDPDLLLEADDAIRRMESVVASWPPELGHNFTLKPRLGTSGRGRVPGVDGRVDSPAVRGALKRLAKRGGAILEPWFKRKIDLSAQMHVAANGEVTLLGSMEQIVAPSGVYLGHRAEIDSRGRVFSGSVFDETLRETAVLAAIRASTEGFFGPCGIDAFSFEVPDCSKGPQEILRPIVEFNARFTLGTIAIGLIRRALSQIKEPLDLGPGARRAFYFGLDAPKSGWSRAFDEITGKKVLIPLWHASDEVKPAILFAESREALDAVVWSARQSKAKHQPRSSIGIS
ncbi:MAG: DUF455 family protein [Deltaproteobacteria bacterium]|nr:DUF455 family protein [Deltaproteobacteria bacterium]